MYYKIINNMRALSYCDVIQLEYDHQPLLAGQYISNPEESLILADGWRIYVPPDTSEVDLSSNEDLQLQTLVYMIDDATNTEPIVYTLHSVVYEEFKTDTTEYMYNEETYIGVFNYAEAKNITISRV